MEKSSVANASSEDLSLQSSASNLSSASLAAAESSPDVEASAAVQPGRMLPAGSSQSSMLDGGYTEVSDSGTAQAGDLPQSPQETAKERFVSKYES